MNRLAIILRSKAFWGSVLAAVGWLLEQQHIGVPQLLQAGGAVLTTTGLRDAIGRASVELLSELAKRHHVLQEPE